MSAKGILRSDEWFWTGTVTAFMTMDAAISPFDPNRFSS
jgi:hypothetical protein